MRRSPVKILLLATFICCTISSSAQQIKISDMVVLLDKTRELFDSTFWKSVTFYESFGKPMAIIDNELQKYGFEFNNFDVEEGYYDEVDLRYLTERQPRREFRFTINADQRNSLSYNYSEVSELERLILELNTIGGVFFKEKRDTISVPGMNNISINREYIYNDKKIIFTGSWFVTSRSAGKPEYYVWIRYN